MTQRETNHASAIATINAMAPPQPSHAGKKIAAVEIIVVMKLIAGRTQDLADIEAIVDSGIDRELLRTAVRKTLPDRADLLERLFKNVDRGGR